jgi:hypothetical protein
VKANYSSLPNSDGTTWQPMDAALSVTVSPSTSANSMVGANADLFTDTAGYNQDIGIFVNVDGAASDTLLLWKESGGFAGTLSPNAVFAQKAYEMLAGHTYVFKLKWKTNHNAPGVTIYAGAGAGTSFPTRSPTRLTVELDN